MEEKISSNPGLETTSQENPTQPNESKRKYVLLGGMSFFVVLGALALFMQTPSQPAQELRNTIKKAVGQPTDIPKPTPYQFYELSIPYLREQTYDTKVAPLEEVSSNDIYTSYVTSYTSTGLKINGLLTQPKGEVPEGGWPAIVFIHGYIPPSQYATLGQPYSRYVDYLASQGFVVFKIDLRGHGDSEGEPGGAYYSSDYVMDALNAHTALQTVDFVHKEKIGLWGHSMAGNISLRALATKPEIPAAVIWGGAGFSYTDLATYRITDASFDPSQSSSTRMRKREQIRKLYGDPDPSTPFWQQVAPTSYLNELQGAIQLHHAVDDDVVSVNYSRDLNALLDKTSVPHKLYEYPSGGHNITDPSFTEAMERTTEFYKKYL